MQQQRVVTQMSSQRFLTLAHLRTCGGSIELLLANRPNIHGIVISAMIGPRVLSNAVMSRWACGPAGLLWTTTPIGSAANQGHADVIISLLRNWASPDIGSTVGPFGMLRSYTPLYMAANGGHIDAVSALLKGGALPDAGATSGAFKLDTPLQIAKDEGYGEVVRALLQAGATDPSERTEL